MQISVVMFDLGGVLVDVDNPRLVSSLALLYRRTVAEVETRVFDSGLKHAFDSGRLTPDAFHQAVSDALERSDVDGARFAATWCDIFTERHATTALLPGLATKVKLLVGSNTDPLHAGFLRDTHRWTDCFAEAWLSFEAGVCKPEVAFWQGALEHFGHAPEEVLFLDDRPENIASAALLGLRTVHVSDETSALAGLAYFGLL